MSSWHRNEYILKGLFLGFWTFVALQVAVDPNAVRSDLPWVFGWVATGLAIGLICGTLLQIRRGVMPWHNPKAFPLLVLLESPTFIYFGIVLGLTVGVFSGREFAEPWAGKIASWFGLTSDDIRHVTSANLPDDHPQKGRLPGDWLGYCVVGGALLGFGLYRLRQVEDTKWRFFTGLAVAAICVYLGSEYAQEIPGLRGEEGRAARFNLGIYILLGLPFFYLLTFCGEAEESEAEIMALCAALGVSIHLMDLPGQMVNLGPAIAFLLPVTIYFVYATRVLPGLRVFKHVLRGYSYLNLGRLREAICFFRRALELDPASPLAQQGMLALHNKLSLAQVESDPALVEILDFGLCLDRAEAFLIGIRPSPEQRAEAERFLKLVEQKKPAYQARVDYLRAVSLTHAKDFDAAALVLAKLLDPETPDYHPKVRGAVLYPAWNLALHWHPEIERRVGWNELNKSGRRIEAILAVERHIRANPADDAAKELKTLLYSQLQESEFVAAAANGPPADFNYDYVEQLGLALVDDPDAERREHGMAYLRIAGRGLVERGPGIFKKLADVSTRLGDAEGSQAYLEQVKRCGLFAKPANLAKDQREIYFTTLKKLADLADARGDYEAAIGELRLYLEGGGTGELNVYRRLAELYGKLGDAMNALLMVETALTYNSTDADLIEKKHSYYYSVTEEKLLSVKDKVASYFDTSYCVKKAMALLNATADNTEMIDWATHLSKLATIMQPNSNGVRLVQARCLLRQGDRDGGLAILEDIREAKKGSGEDEEAWYAATKILGQLYLDELNRPDLAVRAFLDYKEYGKSGADTLFQLARAYEMQNDTANAIRFYEAVTAYEAHPRFWDAKESLRRLGKNV
jgi:tetratricopeptide (TPR) repeat protein